MVIAKPLANKAGKFATLAEVTLPPVLFVVAVLEVKSNSHCAKVSGFSGHNRAGSTHVCVLLQHIETSQSGWSLLQSLQEFCGPGSVGVGSTGTCRVGAGRVGTVRVGTGRVGTVRVGAGGVGARRVGILSQDTGGGTEGRKNESRKLHGDQHAKWKRMWNVGGGRSLMRT